MAARPSEHGISTFSARMSRSESADQDSRQLRIPKRNAPVFGKKPQCRPAGCGCATARHNCEISKILEVVLKRTLEVVQQAVEHKPNVSRIWGLNGRCRIPEPAFSSAFQLCSTLEHGERGVATHAPLVFHLSNKV